MGDTVYNPFACEANATFGQCFPDLPGYTLFSEETYHAMNYLSSASHAIEYATSSSTAYVFNLPPLQKASHVISETIPFSPCFPRRRPLKPHPA